MTPRWTIIDQDARYAEWLRHHLSILYPDSNIMVGDPAGLEQWIDSPASPDCDVLLMTAMFGSSPDDPLAKGLEWLRRLRARPDGPAIIAIAEEGNELTAVRALQLGAVDYLPKRLLTPERLRNSARLAARRIEKRTDAKEALAPAPEPAPEPSTVVAPHAILGVSTPTQAEAPEPASLEIPRGADAEARSAAKAEGATASRENVDAMLSRETRPRRNPTPTHKRAPPKALAPGGGYVPADFIPGYVIRATVGESEKATVYLATSAALCHNVALKVSKTLRDEAAGRQFLEREYTAIVAIRHPSVVQIYDYGIQGGYEYLAMEYLPRGDLKVRMQRGVTEQESLSYIAKIAGALGVVHQAGLLHRDLKPPNIMMRDHDDVALIDFGLARALDGSTPNTRTGVLRGSPYYMSPEQALGEQLDARSDFYSLGVIFYEMLTGRKPYSGGSAMDVLQQHVHASTPRLPPSVAHNEPLLMRLMAKSREDRYQKAEDIVAAFTAALAAGEAESNVA